MGGQMDEWIDNLGPVEGAESLVRKKKEFNIDEQVQSQHGQSPLQVLLASCGRSDHPVLKRKGSFLGALVKECLAGRQPFSGSPRGVWAGATGKKAKSRTLLWVISTTEQCGGSFLYLFFLLLDFSPLLFPNFLFSFKLDLSSLRHELT